MKRLSYACAIAIAVLSPLAASAAEIKLKTSYHDAIGTPIDLGMRRLADLVKERSNGRIELELYPANQLGSEPQGVEGMSLGAIDLGAVVGATYGGFVDEANVLGMLYTFRDVDHMEKAMSGQLGEVIAKRLLEDHDIHMMDGTWYFGTRQITSKTPIRTVDDLKGIKLRVVPVPVYELAWRMMGATPTPIVGADLFAAIETGVVDAQENPPPISKGYGVLLVHKYMTLSNHVIANVVVSMSEQSYQRLSPADRELMQQAIKDAGAFQRKTAIEAEQKVINEFKANGGTVIEPDVAAFQAKAVGIPAAFMDGKYEQLQKSVQDIK